MTDREIIQGLIDRDNRITEQFFFVKCRPLLLSIMQFVFRSPVDYDEMVNELYNYLMADDGARLRQFQYRSTLCQWLKVVATRFFIRHRDALIENVSKEPLYKQSTDDSMDPASRIADRIDIPRLLDWMENRRYAEVIRRLVLEDMAPERYAAEIGVTVDNLYNMKKRAMAALARLAIICYRYGK